MDDMAAAVLWSSLGAALAIVTVTDVRARVIPDTVLIAASVVAVATLALAAPSALAGRLAAATATGTLLLALAVARPGGLGFGDVKLGALLGLYLGGAVVTALLIAFGAGALWGLGPIAARGWPARAETIPFAPFLAIGAAVVVLAADNVDPWS